MTVLKFIYIVFMLVNLLAAILFYLRFKATSDRWAGTMVFINGGAFFWMLLIYIFTIFDIRPF